MNTKVLYLLGIFLTIIIGSLFYYYHCNDCFLNSTVKSSTTVVESDAKTTINPLSIKDNQGNLDLRVNDNFNFKISDFNILTPISSQVKNTIIETKDYLSNDSLKTIHIVGYYKATENNISTFSDLGLARANAIKTYIISLGIPSEKIQTVGKLSNVMIPDSNNIFHGPLSINVNTIKTEDLAIEDHSEMDPILKEPLVLNFNFAKNTVRLTDGQRTYINILSNYIAKNDAVNIQITGFTDNIGNKENNLKLGKQRADFIKSTLTENGIPENRIQTNSQGLEHPIGANNTEEGRAINRRVEIQIN